MFYLEHLASIKSSKNNRIANIGQNIAIAYLDKHGYTIIATNLYINRDEIDIIARKGKTEFCIEVKTRRTKSYEQAEYHFTPQKIAKLKRSALAYSHLYKIPEEHIKIQGIAINLNFSSKMANIKHYISLISFFYLILAINL